MAAGCSLGFSLNVSSECGRSACGDNCASARCCRALTGSCALAAESTEPLEVHAASESHK